MATTMLSCSVFRPKKHDDRKVPLVWPQTDSSGEDVGPPHPLYSFVIADLIENGKSGTHGQPYRRAKRNRRKQLHSLLVLLLNRVESDTDRKSE
jgi:hypothetical protein